MKPSKHVPKELRKEMDRLFASLVQFDEKIAEINSEYEVKTKAITEYYSGVLAPIEDEHKAHTKALQALIRKRAGELFDHPDSAEDKVYTALGVALRQVGEKLKASKQTLALCEKQGFVDVVKIAKTLDRAKLATYPADKLALVESEMKDFVEYGFEMKEAAK